MSVIATISPPAARISSVTTLSCSGTKPSSRREAHVIGTPAIAMESFIAIRLPLRIPSRSATTRHQRTTAPRGSSPGSGRRPASRVASMFSTGAASAVSSVSSTESTASARARYSEASAGSMR